MAHNERQLQFEFEQNEQMERYAIQALLQAVHSEIETGRKEETYEQ